MERRTEPRIEVNQVVKVTRLGDEQSTGSGTVISISGGGIGVIVDHPLPVGEPVQVELPDILVLGDVRHCTQDGQQYRAGIELIQRLTQDQLAALVESLRNNPADD
jgi:hypothetical protein